MKPTCFLIYIYIDFDHVSEKHSWGNIDDSMSKSESDNPPPYTIYRLEYVIRYAISIIDQHTTSR